MAPIGLVLDRRQRLLEREEQRLRRQMRTDVLVMLALIGLLYLCGKLAPWLTAPPSMY